MVLVRAPLADGTLELLSDLALFFGTAGDVKCKFSID